ncbi:MAG TPA: DUF6531 domain-containing protein [Candidatus Binatia bacterium]|jgi:RHS repeat-associated protein|nr:DUF6531 domain-containing protein [Candidatus Binatia bacterium]
MKSRNLSASGLLLSLGLICFAGIETQAQANAANSGRFTRGTGTNATYQSFIVPLDGEVGVPGGPAPIMAAYGQPNLYHYDATNTQPQQYITNRIAISNAVAAFGSKYGGSPLYIGQAYHFGAYAGTWILQSRTNAFLITVTDRTSGAFVTNQSYTMPIHSVSGEWTNFLAAGDSASVTVPGLTTTFSVLPDEAWGTSFIGSLALTHQADSTAANYEYTVWMLGATDQGPMVENADWSAAWAPLYSLDFDARPVWRATFVDQPQFQGAPLPPSYEGKSVTELLAVQAVVTNAVSSSATNWLDLDNSPELRDHPTLDQFVTDMGSNALALASYVFNEIELTDAIAYNNDTNKLTDTSVNLGGVNRSALGTFMEGQGSPVEQCALLIYLLRRAGVPAAYIYAPYDGVQMLDARLSTLLRMQIKGAVNSNGQIYTTNSLVSVNYPWVAAYINGQWVHLFPWLKDTQVVEGLNLYDYMPTNYNNAYKWVRQYLLGDTNIFSLSTETDVPSVLFRKFLQNALLTNAPGISLDDIGTRAFNRRVQYARWSDFPTPFAVTNGAVNTVHDLTSITNVYPTWTNIFDTISVQVFSDRNTNNSLFTGDLRTLDLHNRKFLVRHVATNGNYSLILSLAPFRPAATNVMAFTNDSALTNQQQLTMTLTTADDQLTVRFTRKRHRTESSTVTNANYWASYLGLSETLTESNDSLMRLGDLAAICLNAGRVTKRMEETWAQEYWAMQQRVQANPLITNSLSPDITQGTLPYLMGMAYYERVDLFGGQLQQLHKVQVGSLVAQGLSKLSAKRDSSGNLTSPLSLVHPNVDMSYFAMSSFGNKSLRPDLGADAAQEFVGFPRIWATECSAQEHKVIEDFYAKTGGVSTVRLLLQAQQPGQPGMIVLDPNNYTNYPNLPTYDAGIWQQVTNAFNTNYNGFSTVFITASPVTNTNVGYTGMGAMIFTENSLAALISANQMPQNGGWGDPLTDPIYSPPDFNFIDLSFNLSDASGWNVTYFNSVSPPATVPLAETVSWWDATTTCNYFSSYSYGGANIAQQQQFDVAASSLGFSGAAAYQDTVNYGGDYDSHVGPEFAQLASAIADPVNAVTGEFYIEGTDLNLPGPMSLIIRRNYSSQDVDLGDSQFGYGWRPAYQPYLRLVTNNLIYAAEMDGTVVAYRQPVAGTNFWQPTAADNSQLNNRSSAGIGSTANLFNNYITNFSNVSGTNYYLTGTDGSLRRFQVMAFPVTGTNGTIERSRPYLQKWTDVNGNSYTFSYQTDNTQPDYGQLKRIQSSNGNFLDFYYDVFAHIVQALTGDGRLLNYDYDDHGDLVTVTLPDESQINYTYQHTTGVTNSVTNIFSTHLIIEEDKPDGRVLANAYDGLRRVVTQAATVGNDLNPITNATFSYSNNFTNLTNALITGTTYIKDVFGHTNTYQYTSNLITSITDELGQTETQVWFSNTNDAGYYPHSLKSRTDKRLLRTDYQYDSFGNLTQAVLTGNLTGDGATNETATFSFTYTNRNLFSTVTDPMTNKAVYYYTNAALPMSPTMVVRQANGAGVSTNQYFYTNVVQTVTNGAVTTNSAFGLLQRVIRGGSATNDSFYDGRGFLTQTVAYTGTGDPAVTNTYFYTARGELEQRTDAAGRNQRFAYDAMGRKTVEEVYEANASIPLAWKYSYYSENGDLVWTDGPRYNPEDYVWRDYDGAGRKITEIHWRCEGKADGSGVQPPADGDLYATTFFQYDPFNNLTNVIDPLGNHVVKNHDAIGQLTNEVAYSAAGVAMATNSFGYESGGQVSRIVNPLGGVTTRQFTYTGKMMIQTNADGSTNGWRYYLDGRVQRQFQGNGDYWESTYDDANRKTIRIFHAASGPGLATNIVQTDTRGNAIQVTDQGGNTFTNFFDGLDRRKVATGPVIQVVGLNLDLTTYTTNLTQQITAYVYDSSGQTLTVTNAASEKTVTTSDALGRPTQVTAYASNAVTPLRVTSYTYGSNHNSVTVTNGSGGGAVATTTFTDNDGNTVLTVGYPTNGIQEYLWQKYDRAANRIARQQCSISGSQVTIWATNGWTYDGLNRVATETNRDGVFAVYARDALGDVLSRSMPGGLTWSATYLSDGRKATEQETGGSLTSRAMSYSYFGAGSPFAGLLQTMINGRSTTNTYSYDDFLRLTNLTTTGSAAEQQTSTAYQYDRRSLLTNLVQSFSTNTGPATTVLRQFDSYGQITYETVSVGGSGLSGIVQNWDGAGRRSKLDFGQQNYGFRHQADGLMTAADGSSFGYGDNGLLIGRTNNYRTYVVTQRDGAGRVLQTQTTVNSTNLSETLSWRNDGRLASYTAGRLNDFTNACTYGYAPYSQRLTQEVFNVSAIQKFTNNYTFDNGQAGGLGNLTSIGTPAQSTNTWSAPVSGGLDGLNRVANEQTAILRRPATGLALGAASVSATLNGNPVSVQFDGTDAEGRWRAMVDMTPGSNTLRLAAIHPSGLYTAHATNTFNTTGGADTVTNAFDGDGNVTKRVWLSSNGQTNRTQTFTWDAFDRLIKVSERDSVGSGQDWVGIFDGLGRKVRTTTTLVVSNTPITSPADAVSTVDSWFDPQVEFQEVGVVVNGGVFNMKTYGPDANGVHGGLQGVGGLERVTPFGHISGIGLLQDFFGNIIGSVTNASSGVAWNPARFSSIGPVPGYQSPALTLNANLAQSVGWRGKHVEATCIYHWGARPYEPGSGRFLAHDPVLDLANPGGFSFCGGDPLNQFDPDGRFSKGFSEGLNTYANKLENNVLGFMADIGIISPMTALNNSQQTHEPGYYVYPSAAYEAGVNAGYSALPNAVMLATMLLMPELGGGEVGALEAEAGVARAEVSAFGTEARVALGEEEAIAAEAGSAAQAESGLLAQEANQPLLLTQGSLESRVTANYQRYYNEEWVKVVDRFNQGKTVVPAGMNWETVLGQKVDAAARARTLLFLEREGVQEGPGNQILVNRWLRDPTGSDAYRIPDLRIPGEGVIIEGTIGDKTFASPQIQDFINFSGGNRVVIIRPTIGAGFGH